MLFKERALALNSKIAISSTTVVISYAPGNLFLDEPLVFITVNGAITDVAWTHQTTVGPLGLVYSGLTLVFDAAAVGLTASLSVDGTQAPA